jgi:RHS repeat-associated protein
VTVNGAPTPDDTFTFDTTDETISDNHGVTTTNFTYDRYGNLLTGSTSVVSTTSYAYDLADRLNSITQADGSTVGFTFDAAGRHATRSAGTGANTTTLDTYSYLGSTDSVIVDVSAASGGTTLYAGIDVMGDRLATSTAAAGFAWIVPDLHGNVVAQCALDGTLTDVFRYDAYGNAIGNTMTTGVASPWRFQGRILESTGGSATYDFGARAYVPDLGTFTSLDSLAGSAQNPITLNRYLYALANPVTMVDPDGHCARVTADGDCINGSAVTQADRISWARYTGTPVDWEGVRNSRAVAAAALRKQRQQAAIDAAAAAAAASAPRECGFFGTSCIDVGGVARTVGGGIGSAGGAYVNFENQLWQHTGGAVVDYGINHPQQVLEAVAVLTAVTGCTLAPEVCLAGALIGGVSGLTGYVGGTEIGNVSD